MGPFEAFYASDVQHPWLLWASAALALVYSLSRRGLDPSVRRYCVILTALSLADAWLTSSPVYGLGALPGEAARLVPLFFVIAGDFRFLFLFGAAQPGGRVAPPPRALATAAALSVVVPVVSQLLVWALPASGSGRVLFLVYELLFLCLTLGLLRWHPRVREVAWIVPVARFVLLYYGLWAAADAMLLATGSDLGFALRVVPNVLYYGGLIAVIARSATPPSAPRAG